MNSVKAIRFVLIGFFFNLSLHAKWVVVTGEAYLLGNITQEEVRMKALQDARNKASAKVVGIHIKAQEMFLESDLKESFTKITQEELYGRIVDEKILHEEIEPIKVHGKPVVVYKIKLKANVIEEKGSPDPNFKINLALNKPIFKDGDEMIIKLKASEDCYVTVFNFLANDSVIVLFPNQIMQDNFIKRAVLYEIPQKELREKSVKFRVGLPKSKEEVTECIAVIATKKKYEFGEISEKESQLQGDFAILPTYKDALIKLNKWLVSIPLNERTSDFISYKIVK